MKIRNVLGVAAALCTSAVALAQPANDNCAGAIGLSIPSSTAGTLVLATPEPGPPQTCTTTYNNASAAVWYTLVGNGNTLTVDLCSTAVSADSKLHIYCSTNANPCNVITSWSCVIGNDDGAAPCQTASPIRLSKATFCSAAGQIYYILVSSFTAGVSFPFTITVTDGASCATAVSCAGTTLGACCNNTTQVCTVVAQASCAAGSTFQGIGSACTFISPCPGVGACCSSTGTCTITLPANCTGTSAHQGVGTACLPTNICSAQLRACCTGTGTCTLTMPTAGACAATSRFLAASTTCTPTNPCAAEVGSCCAGGGATCTVTFAPTGTPAGCTTAGSVYGGVGTTCTPNPCGGACCNGTVCTSTTMAGCAGSFLGLGTACSPNPCSGACCNGTTCTLTNPAGCAFVYKGAGSLCSPTPCPNPLCTPSVPNDECVNATIMGGTGFDVFGDTTCATTDPMPAVCISTIKDQWWAFTPSASGNYSIRTCAAGTGTTFDTVISVHTACPTALANNLIPVVVGTTCPTATNCSCSDDNCTGAVGPSTIPSIALNAGTTYWIRVAVWASASVTNNPFELVVGALVGSCCNNSTGACTVTTLASCPGPNAWTLGAVCSSSTCGGRCCVFDGTCVTNASIAGCASGQTYGGLGSTCTPNTCPIPSGSCCDAMGGCTIELATNCTGTNIFAGTPTCEPGFCVRGSCIVTGTPCNTCTQTIFAFCNGTFNGGGACPPGVVNDFCSAAIALTLSVPVNGDNTCATDAGDGPAGTGGDCDASNHSMWYSFTPTHTAAYSVNTCTATTLDTELVVFTTPDCLAFTQVACSDDGCSLQSSVSPVLTAGTDYRIRIGSFSTTTVGTFQVVVTNVNALGSCCAADGSCTQTDLANCANSFNSGGACSPNICPQPAGACCCGSTCSATLAAGCTGTNQAFKGSGTVCNAFGVNNTTPCCFADYNQNGSVGVQDIFDFLAAYFGADSCADINASGPPPSVQDIFDFLATYFAGCP